MPFNLVGFAEATPGAGIVPLNVALNEQLYRVVVDDLYITKEAPYVLGVFGIGTSTLGDILLRQAKMIDYAIKKTSLVADVAPLCSFTDYFGRPLPLRVDKLSVLAVNATDEANLVGVMLGSGKITQAMKDQVNPTHVISGYGDTNTVAYTWTHVPITWNQALDAGIYEIVGMRGSIFGNTEMGLMRLSIPGSQSWKPGVPAAQASADHEEWQSLEELPAKDWAVMGIQFDTEHLPNIEVLSIGVNSDENVELTLQKVG
ncbi:unnamed protein product [marine sediment metagenome]|uniref:Uncharacterized protein n=1 Tax=marine sediment metagenome TaxID=412755 RepID=X1AM27_9ZZZZ